MAVNLSGLTLKVNRQAGDAIQGLVLWPRAHSTAWWPCRRHRIGVPAGRKGVLFFLGIPAPVLIVFPAGQGVETFELLIFLQ